MKHFLILSLLLLVLTPFSSAQNYCLEFDGTDDYIQSNNVVIPSSGDFTVSLWAKLASSPATGTQEFLSQPAGTGGEDFYMGFYNGLLRAGSDWGTSVPCPTDGYWHFYTVVKSATNTHLYIDGVLKASLGYAINNPAGDVFRIGRQRDTYEEYFHGQIDEVQIWNDVRTETEINEFMHQTLTGTEDNLVAYYNFNEGSGTTANDLAGSNTGTLHNMDDGDWIDNTFIDINSGLTGVGDSSVAWGDYDNDGDLDILLTGNTRAKIYKNNLPDSIGFSEQNIDLIGVTYSSVAWGDYDNDGDLDIILTGNSTSTGAISKIYQNNGDNNFIEQTNISLTGVYFGSATWGDYDNDGDLDILLTGYTGSEYISKLYRNHIGQNFTEQTSVDLPGFKYSSVAWGDYDNDGDLDILLSGKTEEGIKSSIYKNNGDNSFTEQLDINLLGVYAGSVAWGDYDNDGDLDILLTGTTGWEGHSKVYCNNSDGSFTETPIDLTGVFYSSIAWGDYDNDGDLDILLTGRDNDDDFISKIYKNDLPDSAFFSEQTSVVLNKVVSSSVAWGDYDNDNDLDILITGVMEDLSRISKIYKNTTPTTNNAPEKPSNFSLDTLMGDSVYLKWDRVTTDKTLPASISYNIKIRNADSTTFFVSPHTSQNNGYRSIACMGNAQLDTSFLFKNLYWDTTYFASVQAIDNSFKGGSFSDEIQFKYSPIQAKQLNAERISSSELILHWTRGNGTSSIVFAKEGASGIASPTNGTTYYFNTIFGESPPIDEPEWYCIYKGRADSTTISGLDPNKQYIIHVIEFHGEKGSEVYLPTIPSDNNYGSFSTMLFQKQIPIALTGVSFSSSVAWGDYDNDGNLDIIISGSPEPNHYATKIYRNNGEGNFETPIDLTGVLSSSLAWGDYDNDGDLDILLTGYTGSERVSKIYKNDLPDSTFFSEQTSIVLTKVEVSSVAWGDYDNDGDLDILLTGYSSTGAISKIYQNNGDNNFIEQTNISLTGVYFGSATWGDYDNDGDLDILLTGYTGSEYISKLYRNHIGQNFTEQTSVDLPGFKYSSVAWGDYDNDGDLDILLSGETEEGRKSSIYKNNGDNSFTEQLDINLLGVYLGSVAWGDYDNDGDLDILLTGYSSTGRISKIYRNNGDIFTDINTDLTGVSSGSVAWGDYDNDGDLDIIITGSDYTTQSITKVYRNNMFTITGNKSNKPPACPTGLTSTIAPNNINLQWEPVSDDETAEKAMSYNLRIRHEDSANWQMASHAADTGYRRIPAMGNIQLNKSCNLKNLPSGKYYWQVQAIDQGYLGSDWSVVDSFQVNNLQAFFTSDTVCFGDSTTFTNQSVCTGSEIATYEWTFSDTSFVSNDSCPKRVFNSAGEHLVTLTITDLKDSTHSKTDTVFVKSTPEARFIADHVCFPNPITFENHTVYEEEIDSWSWEMDGVEFSTDSLPAQQNNTIDTINITLIATAQNGCSDTATSIVYIEETPVANILYEEARDLCPGDTLTLHAGENNIPDYTYRWYRNEIPMDTSTYLIEATLEANYSVAIENTIAHCVDSSDAISVTVYDAIAAPAIQIIGNPVSCQGEPVILYVDYPSTYNYQWYSSVGGVGADSSRYSVVNTESYYAKITYEGKCEQLSADTVDIAFDTIPTIPPIIPSGNPCDSIKLSVRNNDNYDYQWMKNGVDIENATDTSYYVTDVGSKTYSLRVTDITGIGCSAVSEDNPITFFQKPDKPTISTNDPTTFCAGDSARLTIINPNPELDYTWKLNDEGNLGDTSYIYVKADGSYSLKATNSNGCFTTSSAISITVNPTPTKPAIILTGDDEFCEGESATLSVDYDNTNHNFQWYNGNTPVGDNSTELLVNNSGNYTLQISQGECSVATDPTTITVNPVPLPFSIEFDGPTTFCEGDSIVLTVDSIPGSIATYNWFKKGISPDPDIPVATNTRRYVAYESGEFFVEANINNKCFKNSSNTVEVIMNPTPESVETNLGGDPSFCEGNSVRLFIDEQEGFNYQWFRNDTQIDNANTTEFFANESGLYHVYIYNETQCDYTSPAVEVQKSIYPQSNLVTDGDTLVCPDDGVIFQVENNADYTYIWQHDGVTIPNANSHQYTAVEEGKYTVDINNSGCGISTGPREVVFKPAPPKPDLVAEGPNVWILGCSNDTAEQYWWYYNGELIPDETDHIHIANQNLGDYYVTISDGSECNISTDIITIPLGTGIGDVAKFGEIKIYPNPTPGVFNIEMNNQLIGKIYIRITNLNGKELFNLNFQKHTRHFQTQMDLSGQGKGIYLIEFRFEKDMTVRKVVVE